MKKQKEEAIKLILPGFLNISRNEIIIDIYENHKEITLPNSMIYSFYGCFPSCIWNGGRDVRGLRYTKKQMERVRDYHNKRGIHIALTFTNILIREEHLDDEYANLICEVFHNGFNEILVSSPVLEKYIREKYPKYKISKSITSTEDGKLITEGYHLSVLAVKYINDFEYIKKIPIEERKKLEILCNEPCVDNCEFKYKHYLELAHINLGDAPEESQRHQFYGGCRQKSSETFNCYYNQMKTIFYVNPKDIREKYLPLGINYFKINGRETFTPNGYRNIVDYTIQEKYQMDVRTYIMERAILDYQEEIKRSVNLGVYTL